MVSSDIISELLTDWTLAVTHSDISKVQALLKTEPELLWTPIPHTQEEHLEARLLQLGYLGTQFQPLCAIQISILDCKSKELKFISHLVKESTLHDLDTRFWGQCNNTTLHLACFMGNQSIVDLLLERGVSTQTANDLGYLPQDTIYQNIQLKRPKPNYNSKDRFKLLKEMAENSDEKHIVGSLDKKKSEHQYFKKGKVKETQKKVLTEEEQMMEAQQKKRQMEVAQLVKRSAVKNNPLYQKLEKVSTIKRPHAKPIKEIKPLVREQETLEEKVVEDGESKRKQTGDQESAQTEPTRLEKSPMDEPRHGSPNENQQDSNQANCQPNSEDYPEYDTQTEPKEESQTKLREESPSELKEGQAEANEDIHIDLEREEQVESKDSAQHNLDDEDDLVDYNDYVQDEYESEDNVQSGDDSHIDFGVVKQTAVEESSAVDKKITFIESDEESTEECNNENRFVEEAQVPSVEITKEEDSDSLLSTSDDDDDDDIQHVVISATRASALAYKPTILTEEDLREESYMPSPISTATLTDEDDHFNKISDDSGVDIEEEKVVVISTKNDQAFNEREMKRRSGSQKAAWSMSMSSWAAILDREFNLSDLNVDMINKEQRKANKEIADSSTSDISLLDSNSKSDITTLSSSSKLSITMPDRNSSLETSKIEISESDISKLLGSEMDPSRVQMSDLDLSRVQFSDLDLSRGHMSEMDLSRVQFSDLDLSRVHMSEMDLSRVQASQLDLAYSNTSRSDSLSPESMRDKVAPQINVIPVHGQSKSIRRKPLPGIELTSPNTTITQDTPQPHHSNIEPILTPSIHHNTNSGYGKLYLHVNCIQDILLPLPKDRAFVRCVVSDGRFEYMSRYEILDQTIHFDYECVIDAHPDMIITLSLHVRPDFIMKSRKPFSRLFSSRKKKECLSGYVNKEDGAIGQSRFALAHMIPVCSEAQYEAGFSCFNAWYSKSFKERHRQKKKDQDVLKVVGNFNVEMLYLPQSSSQSFPKTLSEYNCQ